MILDEPKWDAIVLKVRQLLDGLKKKAEFGFGPDGPRRKHE
jgi:hypothetical protein